MEFVKFPTRPFYIVRTNMEPELDDPKAIRKDSLAALMPKLVPPQGNNLTTEDGKLKPLFNNFEPSSDQLWMAIPIDSSQKNAKITNVSIDKKEKFLAGNNDIIDFEKDEIFSARQIWSLVSSNLLLHNIPQPTYKFVMYYDTNQAWDNMSNISDFGINLNEVQEDSTNQLFFIFEEEGPINVSSIKYDSEKIIDEFLPTGDFGNDIVVDNTNGLTPITGSRQIQYTSSSTSQFTETKSTESSRSIAATLKVGLAGKILSVGASSTITVTESTTVTLSKESAQTTEETYTYTFDINVPVGKKFQYSISKFMSGYSANYKAEVEIIPSFPGTIPYTFDLEGNYLGSNTAKILFQVTNMISPLEDGNNNIILEHEITKNHDGVQKISERHY